MKHKNFIAIITAVIMALSLTACGGTDGEETALRTAELKDKSFKELGRVYYDEGKIYCALSGTGVEFTFSGTECTVTIEGDDNSSDSSQSDNFARVGIYLNGERIVDDMIDGKQKTYNVMSEAVEKEATVRIVKLSESAMSTFAITDITVNGTAIKPTDDSDRLIEFVGDSITCGYGVDDLEPNHHFSTRTEDCTKAYAVKTAGLLDADYSLVSYSGYGIISGYTSSNTKVTEQTVPQYYEKLGYCWGSNGDFKPSEIDWKFKRHPDAVVINLGTNDDSYCKNIPERCEEYKAEYINFLKQVRKNNSEAAIICTLGIMGQNLYKYIEEAVSEYKSETGDENVYSVMLDNQNQADGIAADWHPSEVSHQKAAEKLSQFIKDILDW